MLTCTVMTSSKQTHIDQIRRLQAAVRLMEDALLQMDTDMTRLELQVNGSPRVGCSGCGYRGYVDAVSALGEIYRQPCPKCIDAWGTIFELWSNP